MNTTGRYIKKSVTLFATALIAVYFFRALVALGASWQSNWEEWRTSANFEHFKAHQLNLPKTLAASLDPAYVKPADRNLIINKTIEQAKRGRSYVLSILDNKIDELEPYAQARLFIYNRWEQKPFQELQTRKAYEQLLVDIASYFYLLAIHERQTKKGYVFMGFFEGTFRITDLRFQPLFETYRELVNAMGYNLGRKKAWVAANCWVYWRDNSHGFPESFGIELATPLLGKFSSILVSCDENGIWFKPERKGCQTKDVFKHALHLGFAMAKRFRFWLLSVDDRPENSQEYVPASIKKSFVALFGSAGRNIANQGIAAMFTYTQEKLATQTLTSQQTQQAKLFLQKLWQTYDALDVRRGNEIVVSTSKLLIESLRFTERTNELYCLLRHLEHLSNLFMTKNYGLIVGSTAQDKHASALAPQQDAALEIIKKDLKVAVKLCLQVAETEEVSCAVRTELTNLAFEFKALLSLRNNMQPWISKHVFEQRKQEPLDSEKLICPA